MKKIGLTVYFYAVDVWAIIRKLAWMHAFIQKEMSNMYTIILHLYKILGLICDLII